MKKRNSFCGARWTLIALAVAVAMTVVLSKGSSNGASSILGVFWTQENSAQYNNYKSQCSKCPRKGGDRKRVVRERERESRESVGGLVLFSGWPFNCTTAAVSALELISMWHPNNRGLHFEALFGASFGAPFGVPGALNCTKQSWLLLFVVRLLPSCSTRCCCCPCCCCSCHCAIESQGIILL